MDATAPWWAVPAFTLAGIVLTQLWNLLTERARRRAERAARLDPDKVGFYRDHVHATWRLLDLAVWPSTRTEAVTPPGPMAEEIRRIGVDIAFSAPARITAAGHRVTETAAALAQTIEKIRDATSRPAGGTLIGEPAEQYASARHRLTEAIDDFIRTARRDIGITAEYLPMSPRR